MPIPPPSAADERAARRALTAPSAAGRGRSRRAISSSASSTVLEPHEMLTRVDVPALAPRTGWAFEEFARRCGDYAIARRGAVTLVARALHGDARIAIAGGGGGRCARRRAEHVLAGRRGRRRVAARRDAAATTRRSTRRRPAGHRASTGAISSACWSSAPCARLAARPRRHGMSDTLDDPRHRERLTHERAVEPRLLLSDFLRHDARPHRHPRRLRARRVRRLHRPARRRQPVRSCLMFAVQADGRALDDRRGPRARAGQAASAAGGVPRMPRAAVRLLHAGHPDDPDGVPRRAPHPTSDAEIREALSGNLCRCTGYQHIVAAVRAAAAQRKDGSK